MIKIIVAVSSNGVIGKENDLPWNLPTDMKHFKSVTSGHAVLMGRKCWESIPEKYRPLPNRENIVVTRNPNYVANGANVVHSLEEGINKYKNSNKILFIIGGAEIYNEAFKYANGLFITDIHNEVVGDITLKGLDLKRWSLQDTSELITENGFEYEMKYYERLKK
jgi:dihydrofolate reductase